MTENNIKEKLQTLVGFVENMEGLINNPYTAGLKTGEMLKDIKSYVQEIILDLTKQEEQATESEVKEVE